MSNKTPYGWAAATLSPKQIASKDFQYAQRLELEWNRKKKAAYKRYKDAIADEAGKCQCDICPQCGKEK
jgi:hypothetical protein